MKARRTKTLAAVIAWSAALFCAAGRTPFTNAAQESKPSSNVPAGNAENGKQLFVKNGCYECHGREGQGSTMTGPRIAPDPLPFEVIQNYIRKPSGEMPPYTAKVLPDKDLADIYAFLQSRKEPPPAAKANPLFK
jgi:mono/diheme cytochrome c family protein